MSTDCVDNGKGAAHPGGLRAEVGRPRDEAAARVRLLTLLVVAKGPHTRVDTALRWGGRATRPLRGCVRARSQGGHANGSKRAYHVFQNLADAQPSWPAGYCRESPSQGCNMAHQFMAHEAAALANVTCTPSTEPPSQPSALPCAKAVMFIYHESAACCPLVYNNRKEIRVFFPGQLLAGERTRNWRCHLPPATTWGSAAWQGPLRITIPSSAGNAIFTNA